MKTMSGSKNVSNSGNDAKRFAFYAGKRLVVLAFCYRVNRKVEGENEMPCLNLETKTKN
jgi:hypothetical protein